MRNFLRTILVLWVVAAILVGWVPLNLTQVQAASPSILLVLHIGSATLELNGALRPIDVAPFVERGRTWVPVRFMAENLAARVDWSQSDWTATITWLFRTIQLTAGSTRVLLDGKQVEEMDVAPFLRDSRLWVPLRFVCEHIGATVQWDGATRAVSLFVPGEFGSVTSVLSGDRFQVQLPSGRQIVRLIGIRAPLPGDPYFTQSQLELSDRIFQKVVMLVGDARERDAQGNLLRYVYLGDSFLNGDMVRRGLAWAQPEPPNQVYQELFELLENEAERNDLGIWYVPPSPTPTPSPSPTVPAGTVSILWSSFQNTAPGGGVIRGEVVNNTAGTIYSVGVSATLFDFQNNVIGTFFALVQTSQLPSGAISPFEIPVSAPFDHYSLQVSWN